jgi:hypothetical protein
MAARIACTETLAVSAGLPLTVVPLWRTRLLSIFILVDGYCSRHAKNRCAEVSVAQQSVELHYNSHLKTTGRSSPVTAAEKKQGKGEPVFGL